jgi:hypothetical protein
MILIVLKINNKFILNNILIILKNYILSKLVKIKIKVNIKVKVIE